jgi:acetyl esterase
MVAAGMPHPDNSNWMSMLIGRPVKLDPPRSPDDIPTRREKFDLSIVNAEPLPDVAQVYRDVELRQRRDGSRLIADIYVPYGEGPFPALVYLHGSMFCLASAWDFRKVARRYAEQGFVAFVVDYALAPERPFPWALEDCVYATRWVARSARDFGANPGRIVLAGDSAGGNLGSATLAYLAGNRTLELDDGGLGGVDPAPKGGAFLYGLYDFPLLMAEPLSNGGSLEVMANQAYLGPHYLSLHRDPLVSPVYADLRRFPPIYLSCGAEDSFVGQTFAFGKALTMANVPVTVSIIQEADHAFQQLDHLIPSAAEELPRIFRWLALTASR